MQLNDVQLTLMRGQGAQRFLHGTLFGTQQIRALLDYGHKSGAALACFLEERGGAAAFGAHINSLNVEKPARSFEHALPVVVQKTVDNAMGGQNDQAAALHADEGR